MKCFGRSNQGQLGYGDTSTRGNLANQMGDYLPEVNLGSGLTAQNLHTGEYHSCVVLNDNSFKCFGDNGFGQLGIGSTDDQGDGSNEMGNYLGPINLGTAVEIQECFDYSPTLSPSISFSPSVSLFPTYYPSISYDPTFNPSMDPTFNPTISFDPTMDPTYNPTMDPTINPTMDPTFNPTMDPTFNPTTSPTLSGCPSNQYLDVSGLFCIDCDCVNGVCQTLDVFDPSCTCDPLWFGSTCNEQQSLATSMGVELTALIVLGALSFPCLCWGGSRSSSNYIRRKRMEPLILKAVAQYSVLKYENEDQELNQDENSNEIEESISPPTPHQYLLAISELFGAILMIFVTFVALYMASIFSLLGKTLILSNSFSSSFDGFDVNIDGMVNALSDFLSPFGFGFISDIYESIYNFITEIDLSVLVVNVGNVTCEGAQAPLELLLNLIVILGVSFLISLDFLPFFNITMRGLFQIIAHKMKKIGFPFFIIVIVGYISTSLGGFLIFLIQVLLSFITFNQFIPVHKSSSTCDKEFSNLDSMIAYLSTFIAYFFLIPALHIILTNFIPGLPEGVRFEEVDWSRMDLIKRMRSNEEENEDHHQHSKSIELQRFDNSLSEERVRSISTELVRRESMIHKIDRSELPSFITILCLIFNDILGGETKYLYNYGYSILWKLKNLIKLTFGIWDEELIKTFQIKEKSELFDGNLEDDENYDQEMIRLKGESHCLVWQYNVYFVILSKFSEGINRSPLYIKSEEIQVDELCPEIEAEIDESRSCEYQMMIYLYNFFNGRISQFIFGMNEFIFEVIISVSPSWEALLIFCILIFPERYVKVVEKYTTTGLNVDNLTHVGRYHLDKAVYCLIISLISVSIFLIITMFTN